MTAGRTLQDLVDVVRSGADYRTIHPRLVERVAAQELAKGRSWKETIKAVRGKLHQVGGAYQTGSFDYAQWSAVLEKLPNQLDSPQLRQFCIDCMANHASTRERLPILERFYAETLAAVGPLHSVLDLACGLNPLAAAWLPLASGARLRACDIYSDQIEFLNHFFTHAGLSGSAFLCDLSAEVPEGEPVQLALMLKTLPCLEQLDRSIAPRLLESIQAEHLLVSFPARSLGGRNKGMIVNYESHFQELVSARPWKVQRFEFSTELAFLITR